MAPTPVSTPQDKMQQLPNISLEELTRALNLVRQLKEKGYDLEEFKLALQFGMTDHAGTGEGQVDEERDGVCEEDDEEPEQDDKAKKNDSTEAASTTESSR